MELAARSKAVRRAALVVLVAAAALSSCRTPASGPKPFAGAPGCTPTPRDSYWHADVRSLPVHERSAAWIASIGAESSVHPDFGSGLWDGGPIGIPYTTVAEGQAPVAITFEYDDESDPGPYPIPPGAPIEGGAGSEGDRHVLVVDRDRCVLYETWSSYPQPDGSWTAGSGAVFDLRSNELRPDGWTSADAAGLPVLPGLVRYEEVAAGRIDHAIRFTAPQTQRAYLWPARHFASSSTDPDRPPMGAWFRLRAGASLEGLSPHARTIAAAMQRHGLLLADNGSPWYITGVPDERWDNDVLAELGRFEGSDFEAVDASSLMVDPDSGQVAG